jgi:hypothetical protein
MEAIRVSETSVLTRATRRHIPEDGIHHGQCRENLKSQTIVQNQFGVSTEPGPHSLQLLQSLRQQGSTEALRPLPQSTNLPIEIYPSTVVFS